MREKEELGEGGGGGGGGGEGGGEGGKEDGRWRQFRWASNLLLLCTLRHIGRTNSCNTA